MKNKEIITPLYAERSRDLLRRIANTISDLILVTTGTEELRIPSSYAGASNPHKIWSLSVNADGILIVEMAGPCRMPLDTFSLHDAVDILGLVLKVLDGTERAGEEAECPFCGSQHIACKEFEYIHCNECGSDYDTGDMRFEASRHAISSHLCGTEEGKPLPVDVPIPGTETRVTGCFHDPDARIWFNLEGDKGPLEPQDIDSFPISVVRRILHHIEKR